MMYRSHIIIDIKWVVMVKMSPNQPYGGKQIIIIFSCKKLSHMKFSEDYVGLVENIIILITVALWEVCCRMFSFIQIPEVGGH